MSSETFTPDKVIGGDFPIKTSPETLESGENLSRGCVMGKKTVGTVAATGLADAGNTGDGTCTGVAAKKNVQPGTYTAKGILAATDGGTFEILAPDGSQVGIAQVGVAFTSDQLDLTINDGTTDFAVGDIFTITTPAGSGELVSVNSAAIDGSGNPYGVLLEDKDASGGAQSIPVALTGEFNEEALTFGGSDTAATHKDAMRKLSMFQVTPITNT